jgi:hypothetical protein
MAILTTADLKVYLGITNSDDDTLIGTLITAAQKVIETYTQRDFEVAADTTRYFTPGHDTCNGVLRLDEDLAQAPTTITNGDGIVVTAAQYALVPRNRAPYNQIRLLSSTGLFWTYTNDPEDAISIIGRWGWSVLPPDDIVQAARRTAGWLYRSKDGQAYDSTAFGELGVIRIKHKIPEDITAMLDPYRRLS